MLYRILLKKNLNGRATSTIFLDDYEEIGTVEAGSKARAALFISLKCRYGDKEALHRDNEYKVDLDQYCTIREIVPGDVLVELESSLSYIFTPSLTWAEVKYLV